jgi:hypothetical protein
MLIDACRVTNPKTILIDDEIDGLACNKGRGMSYNVFVI